MPGAVFVGNGFGKLAGSTQVNELGEIETPILLTSTLSVPRVADTLIDYVLAMPGNEDVESINPLPLWRCGVAAFFFRLGPFRRLSGARAYAPTADAFSTGCFAGVSAIRATPITIRAATPTSSPRAIQ